MIFRVRTALPLLFAAASASASAAFVVVSPRGGLLAVRPPTEVATALSTAVAAATAEADEELHRSLLDAQLKYSSSSSESESGSESESSGGGESVAEAEAEAEAPASGKKPYQRRRRQQQPDGPTIYVGNLSYESTSDDIGELFEPYGPVVQVTVPPDRNTGKCRGFAFVTMENRDDMEKAVDALDQTQFAGRTLYVNESKPKEQQKRELEASKLYVGNISYDTSKEDLTEYFGQFGDVVDVYIPLDRSTGGPRGFAFINISQDDVEAAIAGTDGKVFQGRSLTVSVSLPRGQRAAPRRQSETKLYVGNLSFYTDVDAVRSLFEEYGPVADCYMPADRETGRPRGFAFVTMDPESALRAADETDGYEMDGRIIRVNEAQPKGYSSGGGGGGGGGGDGYYDDDDDSWGDEGDDDGSWGN